MRKTLKKASALLLCVLTCFLTLTGFHGRKGLDPFVIPEELDTAKQINITFWAKNDTNKAQTEIYNEAIREFERIYPNIHVNMRLYTDYGKIYNDVITNIATQTTPNVCITYPDHIATYMTGSNVVVPLDELFADEKYGLSGSELLYDGPLQEEIIPQFLDECRIGEHYYALPYMRSSEACYINKTYVEALGYEVPDVLTWDYIWEVSEAAMEKDAEDNFRVNGQKVMIPFIYKSTDNMMIQYLWQKNAPYSDAEGNISLFNDTTEEFLYEIAEHAKTASFSTFKISSYPANFLNAGQCIFAIDSTAGATWMGSDAPLIDIAEEKIVDFETVVRTIPQVDPDNQKMISQGPSLCLFNKEDPQEVLASWLFLQFLLTNDVQIAYSETEGYVPVTSKAQESEEYQEYLSLRGTDTAHYDIKIDAAEILLNHTEDTFTTPVYSGSASLRDASGQLIENVVKSIRRKETVNDAYMEKLYSDMTALYHLDQGPDRNAGEKTDLGPLPEMSVTLLVVLACVWVLIGIYYLIRLIRDRH